MWIQGKQYQMTIIIHISNDLSVMMLLKKLIFFTIDSKSTTLNGLWQHTRARSFRKIIIRTNDANKEKKNNNIKIDINKTRTINSREPFIGQFIFLKYLQTKIAV